MSMSNELIEYDGSLFTLYEIARREGIPDITLRRNYAKTMDIEFAIKISKVNSGKRGRRLGRKSYNKVNTDLGDENKDLFMEKYLHRSQQIIDFQGLEITLYDMSILIGVKYEKLIILLNEGISIDEIKENYKNQHPAENIKLKSGQTLLEYCINQKLDFSFFYRSIVTYRRKISEVLKQSKIGNNEIPINWIYEKYEGIFKQLELNDVQIAAITYTLRTKKTTLDEALEQCTIRKNARRLGIGDEWGKVLYNLEKIRKLIGEEFHNEISINENEREFLDSCEREKIALRRKLQQASDSKKRKKAEEDITHD